MIRAFSIAIALTIACSSIARADSDGYFCVGRNYIAYQFGLAPPPVAPHRLTIIRFDRQGLGTPVVVDLPQFQVHGMVCDDTMIRVASFDAIHTIHLDPLSVPVGAIESVPLAARGQLPAEFTPQRNLASLSRAKSTLKPERLVLLRLATGHRFELEIMPSPGALPCVTNLVTRVTRLDASGKVVDARPVFTGDGYRECGGDSPAG